MRALAQVQRLAVAAMAIAIGIAILWSVASHLAAHEFGPGPFVGIAAGLGLLVAGVARGLADLRIRPVVPAAEPPPGQVRTVTLLIDSFEPVAQIAVVKAQALADRLGHD